MVAKLQATKLQSASSFTFLSATLCARGAEGRGADCNGVCWPAHALWLCLQTGHTCPKRKIEPRQIPHAAPSSNGDGGGGSLKNERAQHWGRSLYAIRANRRADDVDSDNDDNANWASKVSATARICTSEHVSVCLSVCVWSHRQRRVPTSLPKPKLAERVRERRQRGSVFVCC